MMYDSILARSFSRHEQKRLGYGAIICCLILALFFCTFLKPYFGPIPDLNLQLSMGVGLRMLAVKATKSSQQMIAKTALRQNKYYISRSDSDHIQQGIDSTSQKGHYDGENFSKSGSRNVANNVQKVNSTITSQHYDWDVKTNMSRNGTLQEENSTTPQQYSVKEVVTKKTEPLVLCNTKGPRTELCEIKTDAIFSAKSSSVFVVSSSKAEYMSAYGSTIIRPYARKEDTAAMGQVRKWSVQVKSAEGLAEIPRCTRNHSVPAILFSLGGYAGNNFHDFTDVVIPLFITARQYNREVQFLVTDSKFYFVKKFQKVLNGLSKYEPIAIDKEAQQVHCFPSATIGLKRHPNEMSIDPEKHSTSMKEFREFLRNTFSLNRAKATAIKDSLPRKKPQLLILSRQKTRAFTNIGEIIATARSLDYKVTIAEAGSNLASFAEAVNSCDVLMGIHGAGLANMVFLPENAVLIQIIPIGGFEWLAQTDFELPSKDMDLSYLEYKISEEESTLINQYPIDHTVFTNPYSIQRQGWEDFKSIYLDNQNVNLNVNRFKPTLVKALQLLHDQSVGKK